MGSWISKGVSLDDWKDDIKLSFSWYWWLALIPGSFEQLYLGSPKTFLLKNVLNVVLLGYPWLYEIFMATWAQPQVKLFGSPNPLTHSIHVGGGRFAKTEGEVSPTHARAITYPFVLFLLGLIGGDSFMMGNYTTGFFRLFCTMTGILLPISLIWWVYKMFLYIFVTDSIYAQDGEYFGYPPANKGNCPSTLNQLTGWMFTVAKAVTSPIPIVGPAVTTAADTFTATVGFLVTVFGFTVDQATAAAQGIQAIATTTKPPDTGGLEEKKEQEVDAAAAAEAKAKGTQKGGGSPVLDTSSALGALLTGTLGFIIVSSIVLSWRRTYQNASGPQATDKRSSESNDVPPEPRGARATSQGA